MPLIDVAPLEASIEIAAQPARVWSLVADLRNLARWSPQVRKTIIRGGTMRVGAKLLNINRRGLLVWEASRPSPGRCSAAWSRH